MSSLDFPSADNRPIVACKIQEQDINILADCGAQISVCNVDWIRKFNRKLQTPLRKFEVPKSLSITTASGSRLITHEGYYIPFNIEGRIIPWGVIAVSDLNCNALLGQDFLIATDATVACKTSKIKWPWHNKSKDLFVRTLGANKLDALTTHNLKVEVIDANGHVQRNVSKIGVVSSPSHYIIESLTTPDKDGRFNCMLINAELTETQVAQKEIIGKFTTLDDECELLSVEALATQVVEHTAKQKIPELSREKWKYMMDNLAPHMPEAKEKLQALMRQYHDVFSAGSLDLGRCDTIQHDINLKEPNPVHKKQFRIPVQHRGFIDEYVTKLLAKGCIEASKSPFNAPVFCVKKANGQLRIVLDYRALNDASFDDKYCFAEVQDCVDAVGARNSSIFSSIDLTSGYWQQGLTLKARDFTAFTIPGRGRFQWTCTAMGLKGAPASFSRLMEFIVRGILGVEVYLDDLLAHSSSLADHFVILESIFKRFRQYNMKINIVKSAFCTRTVTYLGFELSGEGLRPGKAKLKAVRDFPEPRTVKQIRQFNGLCNYFRQMIPHFSFLSGELSALTKKESVWSKGPLPERAKRAFEDLKNQLCSEPILAFPHPNRPFTLETDAAAGDEEQLGGLGAILLQENEKGDKRVVSYASRVLKEAERNYSAYLLEMQAIIFGLETNHVYLHGQAHFVVLTDHKPLEKLDKVHTKTLNRLQELMSHYFFELRYRPGIENSAADALSRNAVNALGVGVRIQELQAADRFCTAMSSYLEKKCIPGGNAQLQYISSLSRFCSIIDGILFIDLKRKHQLANLLVIVPEVMQFELLRAAHAHRFAGHGGVDKTMTRLQSRYWWPQMQAQVIDFIKTCDVCQKSKHPAGYLKHKAEQYPLPIPDAPNVAVHVDLFGPLKPSSKGNKYILVMTDRFSKWTEAIPLANKEAETVGEAIFTHWCCRHSVPRDCIFSDRGTEFINKVAFRLYTLLETESQATSAGHPECNASAESFNRSIIKYMAAMMETTRDCWELLLPSLMCMYNTRVHNATNLSPFFLTYLRDPNLPFFEIENSRTLMGEDWASDMLNRLKIAYRLAEQNLTRTKCTQKQIFDKTAQTKEFEIGEKVLLLKSRSEFGGNAKFAKQWTPVFIAQIIGPVTYLVKDWDRPKSKGSKIHVNRLKQYFPRTLHPSMQKHCVSKDKPRTQNSEDIKTDNAEHLRQSVSEDEDDDISFIVSPQTPVHSTSPSTTLTTPTPVIAPVAPTVPATPPPVTPTPPSPSTPSVATPSPAVSAPASSSASTESSSTESSTSSSSPPASPTSHSSSSSPPPSPPPAAPPPPTGVRQRLGHFFGQPSRTRSKGPVEDIPLPKRPAEYKKYTKKK